MSVPRVKIGVFDSGVGGFSLVREMFRRHWDAEIIYVGDTAGFPYSTKTPEVIQDRAITISDHLIKEGCQTILIACNTASMYALAKVRAEYPEIVFFGTVPAIKPALRRIGSERVLLLVTESSAQSEYLQRLVSGEDHSNRVQIVGTTQLVQAIEANDRDWIRQEIEQLCHDYAKEYRHVVLGCTHFPLVTSVFEAVFPEGTVFFTPEYGIADHMEKTLQVPVGEGKTSIRFLNVTGEEDQVMKGEWSQLLAYQDDAERGISSGPSNVPSTSEESR